MCVRGRVCVRKREGVCEGEGVYEGEGGGVCLVREEEWCVSVVEYVGVGRVGGCGWSMWVRGVYEYG